MVPAGVLRGEGAEIEQRKVSSTWPSEARCLGEVRVLHGSEGGGEGRRPEGGPTRHASAGGASLLGLLLLPAPSPHPLLITSSHCPRCPVKTMQCHPQLPASPPPPSARLLQGPHEQAEQVVVEGRQHDHQSHGA